MVFKRHDWTHYGRQGEVVEIKITDASGGKLDNFRCSNNNDYPKVLKIIKEKYGFDPMPKIEKESPNFDKEKDWLAPEENDLLGL